MRPAGAVVAAISVSAFIVIGTINAYDRLVPQCNQRGVCYFSAQKMYEHPVGQGWWGVPFLEIAIPAALVAFFVARAVSPADRLGPAVTAAWLAPLLLVGGYLAYIFAGYLAHPYCCF